MPIASAMNLMGYQGEKPWIQQNEERDLAMAQGKANLGQSLSDLEMQRMQTDALKERQGLLKSFEGRTDSPEFQKKMMSVDPDLVMRMSEHASKLDKRQQDMLKERFKKLAVRATLDDTEEKWNQTGWKQPFSDRNSIISMGATMDQALQMTTGGQSGTAMMRNHAFLTNMGFDPKTAINMLTKSREETPEKFEQDVYQQLLRGGLVNSHEEAVEGAKKAREHYYPGTAPQDSGFRTSAAPARSGEDYSSLWK